MKYIYCTPTGYVHVRRDASTTSEVVYNARRADEIVEDWSSGYQSWRGVELANGVRGHVHEDYIRTWPPALVGDLFGTTATLQAGSRGDYVENLQNCLITGGYLGGTIDGIFGTNTENAVKAYQRKKGLTVDGKVGAATKNALYHEYYMIFDEYAEEHY